MNIIYIALAIGVAMIMVIGYALMKISGEISMEEENAIDETGVEQKFCCTGSCNQGRNCVQRTYENRRKT